MDATQLKTEIAELRNTADRAHERITRLGGEVDVLKSEDAQLVESVGLAKGRVANKDSIESFLQDLQETANRRTVGVYEQLLTGIVADVLPHSGAVTLELKSDRGKGALDINIEKEEGLPENILDGCGGSLSAVISLGLRLIASTKARKRRFIALDEADAWISKERVNSFYAVIQNLSEQFGTQAFIVSHHKPNVLPEKTSVSEIFVDGPNLHAKSLARHTEWTDPDQPGIRFIHLVNFQSHQDTLIPLAPGLNALVGDNNIGKSSVMRALMALRFGECSDAHIKHHSKSLEVRLGIEGGKVISFTRERGRNPVHLWTLYTDDGEIYEEDGMVYQGGGRTPPDWLDEVLDMPLIDDYDVHFSRQKNPIFLLDEPPARRAGILSVGQESGYIREMIDTYATWLREDRTTIRQGEARLTQVRERLASLAPVDILAETVSSLRSNITQLAEHLPRVDALMNDMAILQGKSNELQECRRRLDVFADLPNAAPEVRDTAMLQAMGNHLSRALSELSTVSKIDAATATLPDAPPSPRDTRSLAEHLASLERLVSDVKTQNDLAGAFAELPSEEPSFRNLSQLAADIAHATGLDTEQNALSSLNAALDSIPDEAPVIHDYAALAEDGQHLKRLLDEAEKTSTEGVALDQQLTETRERLEQTLAAAGNACPVCGHDIDNLDHILKDDSHAAA